MSGGGKNEIKETPEEKELARILTDKWDLYQTEIRPLEDQYMQAIAMGEQEYGQAAGATGGAVQRAFGQAEEAAIDQNLQQGLAIGGGQFDRTLTDAALGRGAALGTGLTETANQVQDLHYRGLQKVIDMSLGQANDAQLGLSQVAGQASRAAGERAFNSQYGRQQTAQALGTVAGGAARYGLPGGQPGLQVDPNANLSAYANNPNIMQA